MKVEAVKIYAKIEIVVSKDTRATKIAIFKFTRLDIWRS